MQLTPEQMQQVQLAKIAGEKRVLFSFTAEQKEQWQAAVAQEMESKEANIEDIRKINEAAERPGFIGDICRAIKFSRRPIQELASKIDVDMQLLSDFRAGEAELPATVVDKLLAELGLRLMQEISRHIADVH